MIHAALGAAALLLFAEPAAAIPPSPTTRATPPVAEEDPPRTAKNALFFEALGNGLLYSVNYERFLERWPIGLRGGASYFTYAVSSYGRSGNLTLVSFPLVASYYVAWKKHALQLGLGATILYTGASSDSQGVQFTTARSGLGIAATGVVGYRFLPRARGFSFGAGFTPLVRTSKFLPWGGANVGYVF